jgi:DHA1 family inner membrane transport protein
MPLPLIALFIAAFAFGTTEFVIAGVLPQVADGLGVSIPTAGYLVSGYAIGIAVGGPLLTVATGKVARKTLLIWLALAFIAGQAACALAPSFAAMLLIRVLVAIAHGTFFGVAMVVAVGLVREDRRGMAVAFVLAGLTVSNIVGVPAGTAIGNLFGWRATFWAMFVLGVAALAAMIALLPRSAGAAAAAPELRREIGVLSRQQVWTSLIMMLMLMIGQYVPFTYIAPMLRDVTGLSTALIPIALLINGAGATAGVFVGGRLAGRRPMRAMIVLMVAQAAVLAVFYAVVPHAVPAVAVIALWGCLNFTIGTLIQTRILVWSADAPNLASSLIPAGFNVGIAIAAALGGALLSAGFGYRSLPVLGIFTMLAAAAVAGGSLALERRSGVTPPAPAAS